jgi:hypothetical protein
MQRAGFLSIAVLLLLGQCGCTPKKPPVPLVVIPASEEVRAHFGTVGIVSARYIPDTRFNLPVAGWASGTGRGAKIGGVGSLSLGAKGALGALTAGRSGGKEGAFVTLFLAASSLALGIALAPPAAIVGGVYGAVAAEPVRTVRDAEATLKRLLEQAKVQEVLRDHVLAAARQETRYSFVTFPDQGPLGQTQAADYRNLPNKEIESIVEISLLAVELQSESDSNWEINPSLKLRMPIRVKVVETRNNDVSYVQDFEYVGQERTFTEWASNNAQPLRDEFERCYDTLAKQVVDNVFLVYLFPELRLQKGKPTQ